jgi:hypothetical protein
LEELYLRAEAPKSFMTFCGTDKRTKAVKAIRKAVRKAVKRGITERVVEKAVRQT